MESSCHRVWSKGDKCLALYHNDGEYYPGYIVKISRSPALKFTVQFDGYSKEETETLDQTEIKPLPRKQKEKPDVIIIPDDQNESLFKPLCGKEENRYLESKFRDLSDDEESNISSSSSVLKTPRRKGVVATGGHSVTSTRGRSKQVETCDKQKKSANCTKETITSIEKREKKRSKVFKDDLTHLELKEDVFDSQQPSTSKAALRHQGKPPYINDSSDGASDENTSFQSKPGSKDEDRKPDLSKSDLKKFKYSSTDSTEGENSDFRGFDDVDLEKPKFKFTPSAAKIPYKLSGPDESPVVQVPATINQYLRDYQRKGIQFMYDHYKQGQGAILGDDMGLGKTVQVIGFLSALLRKHGNRIDMIKHKPRFIRQMSDNKRKLCGEENDQIDPFLIIGPGSVLYNWMDELETWGYFTVGKFHGSDKEQCLADTKKGKYEIVITTYETYRDNQESLNSISWSAVIVDEVHKIKGQQAQVTQALKAINTDLRFGLTGTALQNDMIELWCILDWAQPNCLGDAEEFKFNYVDPIKEGQKVDATKRELAEARKLKEKFSAIRNKMLLRRTKQLISDQLPTKEDNVVYCRLTPFQEEVYQCLHDNPLMKTVMRMDDPCDCGSGHITGLCCNKLKEFKVSFREVMFTFLSLFMKVGNHVALLIPDKKSEDNFKPLTKHILKEVYERFPQYFTDSKEASFRTLSDPKYCGKMKVLKGLLSVFYKDHSKVLVFSYSTRVLDIFEQYLMTTEYEYRRIDGSTSIKKRMDLVREFNKDPNIFIFLISTRAGGLGLNLTGANRVVIFDPNWNPTHDLQAQDRAYRIGQRRNVKVYRLISSGTIEENMYLRQIYKQQLDSVAIQNLNANRYFKGIAGDRARQGELFGVKNMFQFRAGDQCLTLEILNENERVETELQGFTVSKYVCTDPEQREKEDNSILSEDESAKANDEVDGNMDSSLLELFGITDRDDFNINNNSIDSNEENYGGDVESQHSTSNKSGYKKMSCGKNSVTKTIPRKAGSRKTSTPAKKSPGSPVRGSKGNKSRLAKSQSSFSSVSDVFDKCGVVHIHENRELVGWSKAEDHMTRCAIQDVYELHQNSQIPAVYCEPMSESDDSIISELVAAKPSRGRKSSKQDHNTPRSSVIGSSKVLIGQTPKAIRLKHFEEMQEFFNTETVELAEKFLSGTVEYRLNMLKDFYSKDKPELSEIFKPEVTLDKAKSVEIGKTKNSSRAKKKGTSNVKKRKKQKENQTLGISFVDLSDSESQNVNHEIDSAGCRIESLEVGMPITSSSRRKPSPSKKSTNCRPKGNTRKTGNKQTFETSSIYTVDDVAEDGDTREIHSTKHEHSDDVEKLLDRIGHQEDVKVPYDHSDLGGRDGNVSVLDDIFSSPEKTKQKRRKPPQKRKQQHKAIFDNDSLEDTSITETSVTEDEDNPIVNVSTLKDDGIDVFSDPLKWKSRKRSQKERVSLVDQMLSDAADDYDELFNSGKMKKVKKSSPAKNPETKIGTGEVTSFDHSASLF